MNKTNKIKQSILAIAIGLALAGGISFAANSWKGPCDNPPACNTSAPITVMAGIQAFEGSKVLKFAKDESGNPSGDSLLIKGGGLGVVGGVFSVKNGTMVLDLDNSDPACIPKKDTNGVLVYNDNCYLRQDSNGNAYWGLVPMVNTTDGTLFVDTPGNGKDKAVETYVIDYNLNKTVIKPRNENWTDWVEVTVDPMFTGNVKGKKIAVSATVGEGTLYICEITNESCPSVGSLNKDSKNFVAYAANNTSSSAQKAIQLDSQNRFKLYFSANDLPSYVLSMTLMRAY